MKNFKLKNVLFGTFLFLLGGFNLRAGQVQIHTIQGDQIVDFLGETLSVDWLQNSGIYRFGIKSITILDSVTKIGRGVFVFYPRLMSVTIPSSVTEIDECAFAFCFSLMSVTIQGSITKIGRGAFMSCPSLAKVDIGGSVEEIGWGAFADCRSLTNIAILGPVGEIGFSAFKGCPFNEERKTSLLERFGPSIF